MHTPLSSMKNRTRFLIFSGILLLLSCGLFSWIKFQCAAPVPVPSVTGGYYEEAFLLELSAPSGGTIYYTTDGSLPTTDSPVYQDGIRIDNRSEEPNRIRAYRNVVKNWKDYTPDPAPVEKGTVVQALYVSNWGFSSEIMTQTYFVGISRPEKGYTLSLIFEEENLFGENGLYVTGKAYDDWYLSGDTSQPEPETNFYKRMETVVTAQMFDASGERINQPVSLRLQGASKRGWNQKRFILECDANLTGINLFPTDIFPNTSTHSLMTKDSDTDAMVYDILSDRSVSLQKSVPVRVYLNGEYLYDWYLLERYDNQYFRQYHDVDNVILVKNGVVDEDVTIDADAYGELMYWVGHTDFSDPEQWEQLTQEVDIQSYIDYISINYYLCNWDFSDDKNHVLWRSAVDEHSPYGDKRWRWCVYDVDALEFTLNNYAVDNAAEVNIFSSPLPYTDVTVNQTVFFKSLRNNPVFCQQFVLSFMDIVNNNFAPERLKPILEKYGLSLDWMDGYFLKRPAYAAKHLAEEFDLTGALETVLIHSDQPSMGTVTVNTSNVDLSQGNWTGTYFTDYPITITATANEGYEFLGWKGDADTQDSTITLNVDGGLALEAVFAKTK